jgi:DNA mismatch endonuclease, patch repair protein
MSDIYSKEKRSKIMARISSKDTSLEILVRKYIFSCGIRYRKNLKELPGKPDIVINKFNVVVFINGCFWHNHGCKSSALPASNSDYWREKINSNVKRDNKNYDRLTQLGWKVIIIWQCEINSFAKRSERLSNLVNDITSIERDNTIYFK